MKQDTDNISKPKTTIYCLNYFNVINSLHTLSNTHLLLQNSRIVMLFFILSYIFNKAIWFHHTLTDFPEKFIICC